MKANSGGNFPIRLEASLFLTKGYTDFTLFNYLCTIGAFFVTRFEGKRHL